MSGHPFFLIVVWLFLAVIRPEFLKGFRLPSDAVYLARFGGSKKGHPYRAQDESRSPDHNTVFHDISLPNCG
ncbi:hypothetical protein GE21DRAFT_1293403 [Neurospora crassa]|nr:hypothetical protein GE21DRAFT_1293403 [Neurospora crassa]